MNDLLFYFLFYSIMGSTGIMLIIAFVFSSKKIRVKKSTGVENLEDIEQPKLVAIPSEYRKYKINIIIAGKKGKVIRYGPDYISTNRALIQEYKDKGIPVETLTFKEIER